MRAAARAGRPADRVVSSSGGIAFRPLGDGTRSGLVGHAAPSARLCVADPAGAAGPRDDDAPAEGNASGQPGTRGGRRRDVRLDRAGLRPGQHADDGRRRRPLAAAAAEAAALGSRAIGARRRLRHGQAERGPRRAGRAVRPGGRGRPRPGDDRSSAGGLRRPRPARASRSATRSPCRSRRRVRRRDDRLRAAQPGRLRGGLSRARPGRPAGRPGRLPRAVAAAAARLGPALPLTFGRMAPLAASAFGHGATYRYLPELARGLPGCRRPLAATMRSARAWSTSPSGGWP